MDRTSSIGCVLLAFALASGCSDDSNADSESGPDTRLEDTVRSEPRASDTSDTSDTDAKQQNREPDSSAKADDAKDSSGEGAGDTIADGDAPRDGDGTTKSSGADPAYGIPDEEIVERQYSPADPPLSYERELTPPACDSSDPDVLLLQPGDDLEAALNRTDKRVFCLEPGDYRGDGITVTTSGSESEPRWLRYYNPAVGDETHPWDMANPETLGAPQRVLMSELDFEGASWWRVDRIRFHERVDLHEGANHNVLNRLMFYRSSVDAGRGGVSILTSSYNTVQNTVIGRIEKTPTADTVGVSIIDGAHHNRVVNCEIFDIFSGDGIQSNKNDCRGIIIQNNDFYLSNQFTGGTENSIDLKCGGADPDSGSLENRSSDDWALVENNRIWGQGWNMIYHWPDVSGVVVRNNKMWDLEKFTYVVHKKEEINFEHHVYDNVVVASEGGFKPRHIDEAVYARNIFVDAGGTDPTWAWYGGPEDNTVTRNVFINSDVGTSQQGNEVRQNAYYNSVPFDGSETGTIEEERASAANHEDLTLPIKRITGPETETLPDARPTGQSPHAEWFGLD